MLLFLFIYIFKSLKNNAREKSGIYVSSEHSFLIDMLLRYGVLYSDIITFMYWWVWDSWFRLAKYFCYNWNDRGKHDAVIFFLIIGGLVCIPGIVSYWCPFLMSVNLILVDSTIIIIGPSRRTHVRSSLVWSWWSLWMGNITKRSRLHIWARYCPKF